MTKSQADVVRVALEVLDDSGAAAVSMRAIAERLGVRMNTVLWHAKSKARLLELMADAIVGGASLDGLPEHWRERATELARRYRAALLAHRDGAVVVAGTYAAEPATLDFAEALVATLLDGGLPAREAAWTCWSLVYFVVGLTQEEQALPGRFTRDLDVGQRPALRRVAPVLMEESFEERFTFGVAKILR
ncbi:TetR family transcriptional regulator [Actinoplanes sp. ATCC 53533]|uniref:TetR/AcrR family transcriptional regulator C-terminal domain-containing protein n=1 Tax=Actinoplanes sp. ATCC 53533 TaxID=1288362 RepID=UPI000F787E96|nr:TetR/AcrR family transcriptional regulator C-terminal domain-containing protein [Actinoplanes sp. ATCC 53533]RSM72211.1 TetR family transcriptional regulator [Actinoplanes sp. ATCC 53533]